MPGSGPLIGGNFSALNISAQTVVKPSIGTFWQAQILTPSASGGAFYDTNVINGGTAANLLATIQPNSVAPITGPFSFFVGLLFVPFGADCSASIFYT